MGLIVDDGCPGCVSRHDLLNLRSDVSTFLISEDFLSNCYGWYLIAVFLVYSLCQHKHYLSSLYSLSKLSLKKCHQVSGKWHKVASLVSLNNGGGGDFGLQHTEQVHGGLRDMGLLGQERAWEAQCWWRADHSHGQGVWHRPAGGALQPDLRGGPQEPPHWYVSHKCQIRPAETLV